MFDERRLTAIIKKMAGEINSRRLRSPILIGIHSGGAHLAEKLKPALNLTDTADAGTLDIAFQRDDFARVGLNPQVKGSDLPAVDGRDIILVDDVLHTGRTVRAALNEIFSYGRPARVCLAVLVERPGRELPVQADVVGASLDLAGDEAAKLTLTDGDLALHVVKQVKQK